MKDTEVFEEKAELEKKRREEEEKEEEEERKTEEIREIEEDDDDYDYYYYDDDEEEEEDIVPTLLTPEAVVMLTVAVGVDVGELLIELVPFVGQILSIIIDIFAVVFFGGWMWIRSGVVTVPKRTVKKASKLVAKTGKWAKRLKWIRPLFFIIELIPVVSSFLPLWILVVFLELRYNS